MKGLRDQIITVIEQVIPGIHKNLDKNLIKEGILDSFDFMNLIAALEDEFGFEFEFEDVVFHNFESIDAITAIVNKYSKG